MDCSVDEDSVGCFFPGKGDEAAHPGGHHQVSGGKEGYQE